MAKLNRYITIGEYEFGFTHNRRDYQTKFQMMSGTDNPFPQEIISSISIPNPTHWDVPYFETDYHIFSIEHNNTPKGVFYINLETKDYWWFAFDDTISKDPQELLDDVAQEIFYMNDIHKLVQK
jgi:hypothetical protein